MTPDLTWEYVADTVMGGVSAGGIAPALIDGRQAMRLTGRVSLDNDGGFVQMAADLRPDGSAFDASGYDGLVCTLWGDGQTYDIRLRTTDLTRPWQSYRVAVVATPAWQTLHLPFTGFEAHRTDHAFDPQRLRRVGILSIGQAGDADVAVADLGFY